MKTIFVPSDDQARVEAADRRRVRDRAPAARDQDLPQPAAVGVNGPDRAPVGARSMRGEEDLVPLRHQFPQLKLMKNWSLPGGVICRMRRPAFPLARSSGAGCRRSVRLCTNRHDIERRHRPLETLQRERAGRLHLDVVFNLGVEAL